MVGLAAMRLFVCTTKEVAPGQKRSFEVEGLSVPVLIANVEGRILATSGMCPHEDVELVDGDHDGIMITCPGHAYEFNLESGGCSHDPDLCLPTYEVIVEDERIYVGLFGQTLTFPPIEPAPKS